MSDGFRKEASIYKPSPARWRENDFCGIDIMGSESSFSRVGTTHNKLRGSPNSEPKYLLYNPQNGLSSQLMSIVYAAHWANAMGRKLVIPPFFAPRVSDSSLKKAVDFSAIFDFKFGEPTSDSSLNLFKGHVEWVQYFEQLESSSPRSIIKIAPTEER